MNSKHIFRPAWWLIVGPKWIVSGMFLAAIIVAASEHLILVRISCWLALAPFAIGAIAHLCWLCGSRLEITPTEVVYKGWPKHEDERGNRQRVYTEICEPRSQWSVYERRGLLYPTVIWTCFGRPITLEKVAHPRLLKRLLFAPEAKFPEQAPSLNLLLLVFAGLAKLSVGLGKLSAALGSALWQLTVKLVRVADGVTRQSGPLLKVVVHWLFQQVQRILIALERKVEVWSSERRSGLPSYGHFISYCQRRFFRRGDGVVACRWAALYVSILERTYIVCTHLNGRKRLELHSRIQSIADIKRRIGRRDFERIVSERLEIADEWAEMSPVQEKTLAAAPYN